MIAYLRRHARRWLTLDQWIRADEVREEDLVLDCNGYRRCLYSYRGGSDTWILRYPYGVRYINPAAPVAVRRRRNLDAPPEV